MSQMFIPGMRVEIRDAEWRIQRVDRASDGGYLLYCTGLSELVRGRSAQFLSKRHAAEKGIAVNITDGCDAIFPLGWDDVKDLPTGFKVLKTCTDNTQPGTDRPTENHDCIIEYIAPFVKQNRETDYKIAWSVFNRQQEAPV